MTKMNLNSHRPRWRSAAWWMASLAMVAAMALLAGCSRTSTPDTPSASSATAEAIDGSPYLSTTKPEDAQGVIAVRESAQDQDHVVITGRIGGSVNPWIEGRAAFSIVDLSLKSCAECGSDDCPKPWDYC